MDSWLILLEPIVCNCAKRNRLSSANKQYQTHHCPEHVREITNSLRRWFGIDFNSLQFMLITPTIIGLYLLVETLLLVDECRHSIRESQSTEIHPRRRRFLRFGYHLFYTFSPVNDDPNNIPSVSGGSSFRARRPFCIRVYNNKKAKRRARRISW